MDDARVAAARVLVALERGRTTLAREIERSRPGSLDARDRALFLELAAGTTRWRDELDARLATVLSRPIARLPPEVRAVLRGAAYQLFHLSRIPARAIVHESVEAARALGQPRAAGFVNGVLRNLVRARDRGAPSGLPPRPGDGASRADQIRYLSIALSHPAWLVARWLDAHGFANTERWCAFNNSPGEISVRAARPDALSRGALLDRLTAAGVDAQPAAYAPDALRLPPGALGRIPPDVRRDLAVQDEGAQIVALAVGARPGDRVLDACASPGGKATLLAARGRGDTLVVAGDHRPGRVATLAATVASTGARIPIVALDAAGALPFDAVFDRVLIDAPCSGLGVLRRDPDIKWQAIDLAAFAAVQARMIREAARVVKPGGTLLYATCSSEPEENDEVVRSFLAERPDFGPAPIEFVGDAQAAATLLDTDGVLRTRPFQHNLDAYYGARLVRRQTA